MRAFAKAVFWFAVAILLLLPLAHAQHMHTDGSIVPKGDEQFVMGWMRRDMPQSSCCNFSDCWPAEMRVRNGGVEARHIPRGPGLPHGPWLEIPEIKNEQNYADPRESPSGLNYMCALGASVLCFTAGAGG
jgi:hypothetical protein